MTCDTWSRSLRRDFKLFHVRKMARDIRNMVEYIRNVAMFLALPRFVTSIDVGKWQPMFPAHNTILLENAYLSISSMFFEQNLVAFG